ncbi:IS66 family transposase [Microcoleus sp. N9_A1]|uniref:IS66 family transposase n=1 Tax=Microcoleus sp. N9_A1 TaxID=3055380 RepID=UPI002FD0418B
MSNKLQERLTQILDLVPDQKDGIRLRKRYGGLIDNLFLFLEDATIPPTNNSSEQAIRMSVIFRRVTNGFRSEWGRANASKFNINRIWYIGAELLSIKKKKIRVYHYETQT